ncbi:hypothetical protein LCGC14_0879210 [marine sediment metagenome]|uniref:Uncharacterized protein n=1 Tax=marine sediment metagenome TaxID=412755 RepID=A0A0F9S9E2_9ZZZZ
MSELMAAVYVMTAMYGGPGLWMIYTGNSYGWLEFVWPAGNRSIQTLLWLQDSVGTK